MCKYPLFIAIGAIVLTLLVSADSVVAEDGKPIEVAATVKPFQSADLYAKVGGYIREMKVDIGDKVEKGEVLAILDVPELDRQLVQKQNLVEQVRAEAEQASSKVEEATAHLSGFLAAVKEAKTKGIQKKALLRFRRTEFERVSGMFERGAVQKELVDSARYQLEAAEAELVGVEAAVETAAANFAGAKASVKRAEADATAAKSKILVAQADADYVKALVNYSIIRAPFTGAITKRMFDAGAFVQNAAGNSAAKPILQVVRVDKMRVAFSLSMSKLKDLDIGDRVTLSRIVALPGQSFEGTVARFSAGLDSETRMMAVEFDLDNAKGELKPGFFGYVKLFAN